MNPSPSQYAAGLPGRVTPLIPVAVAAVLAWWLIRRRGVKARHVAVAALAGFIVAASAVAPDITDLLSQLAGGILR